MPEKPQTRVLTAIEQLQRLLFVIPGHRAMALDLIRRNEEARKSGSRMTTFSDEQILADWYHRDYQHALQLCQANNLPPLPSNEGAAWERFDRLQAWVVEALKCWQQNIQIVAEFQAQIAREQAEREEWKKQHTGPIWDFVEWLDEQLVILTMLGMGGDGGNGCGDDIVEKALAKAIELNVIEYPEKPIVPATTQDKCNLLNWILNRTKALVEPEPDNADSPAVNCKHNGDFTMVEWFGTPYTFAFGVQSSVVKVLWEEWENTGLGLHQETIRERVDAERDNFRMDKLFRKHLAMGMMIQACGDGRYKLGTPSPHQNRNLNNSLRIPSESPQKPV